MDDIFPHFFPLYCYVWICAVSLNLLHSLSWCLVAVQPSPKFHSFMNFRFWVFFFLISFFSSINDKLSCFRWGNWASWLLFVRCFAPITCFKMAMEGRRENIRKTRRRKKGSTWFFLCYLRYFAMHKTIPLSFNAEKKIHRKKLFVTM